MLADREERRLGAMVRQRGQHRRGVARPRAVVEREHDLIQYQEVVGLVLLEAEAGPTGGIDLDCACEAQRIGVSRTRTLRRRRGSERCKGDDRNRDRSPQAHGYPRDNSGFIVLAQPCGAGRTLCKCLTARHMLFCLVCRHAGTAACPTRAPRAFLSCGHNSTTQRCSHQVLHTFHWSNKPGAKCSRVTLRPSPRGSSPSMSMPAPTPTMPPMPT